MKTPEQVLNHHEGKPLQAADELVRRFGESDPSVARFWIDRVSGAQPYWDFDRISRDDARMRAAAQLVVLASQGTQPFEAWAQRITSTQPMWPDATARNATVTMVPVTDPHLLSLLLALWPHRADPLRLPDAVDRLRIMIPPADAWACAMALFDYPDIAFALLGPPRYEPPPEGWCYGCPEHPRGDYHCGAHLALVARRRGRKELHDWREDAVLAAIPDTAFLLEPSMPRAIIEWIASGAPLGRWAPVEDALLRPETPEWTIAVACLCADPNQQARAVELLRIEVESAEDPNAVLLRLTKDPTKAFLGRGLFFGRGWGRDDRPRKLCPLSRALLLRGAWPVAVWTKLLKPPVFWGERPLDMHPDGDAERAIVAQQEVLAEGFLSLILDPTQPVQVRQTALDALERLSPRGNGSWARALSKVKDPPELKARAREVQRSLADERGRTTDAELAISDALEIFFLRPAATS